MYRSGTIVLSHGKVRYVNISHRRVLKDLDRCSFYSQFESSFRNSTWQG